MFYFAVYGKGKHLIMTIWNVDEMLSESVSLLFANTPFFNRLCVSSGKGFRDSDDLITKDCLDWSKIDEG